MVRAARRNVGQGKSSIWIGATFAVLSLILLFAPTAQGAVRFDGSWQATDLDSIAGPAGISVAPDGSIFTVPSFGGVVRSFTPEGKAISQFGPDGYWADDLAVAPDGTILLADGLSLRRYSPKGKLLFTWSRGRGGLKDPSGAQSVAVGPTGSTFVTGEEIGGVIQLGVGGKPVRQFGPRLESGRFRSLDAVAAGPDGSVFVVDRNRVRVFDEAGRQVTSWGGSGWRPGRFFGADDIAVNAFGNVFAVDASLSRVQEFGPDGEFIDQWGSGGSGNGRFFYPEGIAAGPDGSVYVGDATGRVQRFMVDDAPPLPKAAIAFPTLSWNNPILPGKKSTIAFRIINFGDAAATGVEACPPRKGFVSRLFVGGTACRKIGTVGPMSARTVKFRLRPVGTRYSNPYVRLRINSDNAGGGPADTQVAIKPNLRP